jgi:hypothetical protein
VLLPNTVLAQAAQKKGKHGAQPAGKGTFTNSTIHKQKMGSRASHLQCVELQSVELA